MENSAEEKIQTSFFTKTKYKLYFSSHYPLPAVLLLSLGPTVSLLWTITNAFLKT